jgi:hypothetical protein
MTVLDHNADSSRCDLIVPCLEVFLSSAVVQLHAVKSKGDQSIHIFLIALVGVAMVFADAVVSVPSKDIL